MATLLQLPPLSLYVHIPWCVRKCPYCDFNSHTSHIVPEADYIKALIDDLEQELSFVQGRSLTSIFFGGGTPSLFSAQGIETLLRAIETRIPFAADIEITLEANPGTTEREKFTGYHTAGVNRLSIGVQSFNPQHLTTLGRIHNSDDAAFAIETALQAGFAQLNIDLMHGLPEQTAGQAVADMQRAINLGASHISWYQLTIEPNTAFYKRPPDLPEEEQLGDIQTQGEKILREQGFTQYEVSAYCKISPSRHNLNYWQFGDYMGIGAGAHGKITQADTRSIHRCWKTRAPQHYLEAKSHYVAGQRCLSPGELPLEFAMNALRLNQGFTPSLFETRTGLTFNTLTSSLDTLMQRQLLTTDQGRIKTTDLGRRFLNTVLEAF